MSAKKTGFAGQAELVSPARVMNNPEFSFKGENGMKKLATLVFALLLGASLSLAQTGGSTGGKTTDTGKPTDNGKGKKHHHGKKGGKKSKKSTGGTTTPAPK